LTEDALIAQLRVRLNGVPDARLLVGIGDDAAAWQPSRNNRSVITTDALVEGVHFRRGAMDAPSIGHRALAANLSDLAAMGARPVLATIVLGLPPDLEPGWPADCYDGIAALATRTRCAIAGGDITSAPAVLLSITAVGEVRASNLKTRAGARPGDVLAVTGALGASRAGRQLVLERPDSGGTEPVFEAARSAFLRPEPRLREGKWLAGSGHVRAMIDTSDGLSTDLGRLCAASGAGAILEAIPVHPAATAVAALTGDDPEGWALNGGEDFELLAAIDRHAFAHLADRFLKHTGRPLLRVGRVVAEAGIRRLDGTPVEPAGWDHVRG
jgi:thiamine-monophosphate kinase